MTTKTMSTDSKMAKSALFGKFTKIAVTKIKKPLKMGKNSSSQHRQNDPLIKKVESEKQLIKTQSQVNEDSAVDQGNQVDILKSKPQSQSSGSTGQNIDPDKP